MIGKYSEHNREEEEVVVAPFMSFYGMVIIITYDSLQQDVFQD